MTASSGVIPLSELSESDIRSWAELAERAAEHNPYQHPEFVLPAARLQGVGDSVAVAMHAANDEWRACQPVTPARRWRGLPLPGLLAFHHDQSFLGTPLLDGSDPAAALEGLLTALRRAGRGVFAELDHTDRDGPVGEALDRVLPRRDRRFGAYDRAALLRRPEPTYLEGRLKGKHRRSLNRAARDLAAELGGELELVDRAGEQAAGDEFLELEAAGWKGESGTALASLPGGREFFSAMCEGFAARGALELLFLRAGDATVAVRCNLRGGSTILCFKIAHDEELRRFSPGTQMELRMIERFHADETATRMDSCADPGSEMFNRLWPDRRRLGGVLVPARGVGGQAARPVLGAVGRAIDRHRRPEPAQAP